MTSHHTIQQFAVCLTLATSLGIVIHDTKLDKAMVTALALPAILANVDVDKSSRLSGADHTHVERVSFMQAVHAVSDNARSPQAIPRDDKKFKKITKSVAVFGGYSYPVAD